MAELLAVVAHEVAAIGGSVSLHGGAYPPARAETVYVVIPHEYFVFTPPQLHPTRAQRRRTVGFSVEHPGNLTFDRTVRYAATLGAVVDINADATAELRRRGIPAERFTLGYSKRWDAWGGDPETARPIDITYLGTAESRRSRALSIQAGELWQYETAFLMPPHEPMTRPRGDFLVGKQKLDHLAASKILLNLHRGASRSLEWVRVLEAICNGCVVVSERSVDLAPLVPGRHIVVSRTETLGMLAGTLLRHDDRLSAIRDEAYAYCRDELSMRSSAERLVGIAEGLLRRHQGTPASFPFAAHAIWPKQAGPWTEVSFPLTAPNDPEREATYDLLVEHHATSKAATFTDVGRDPGARVAAVLACTGERSPDAAVAALAEQTLPVDIVVGATPTHTLGRLRNLLIARSTAEYLFVLDPRHMCYPTAVQRLVRALDGDPEAGAAYSIVAMSPPGLTNLHPFEPERLARVPYLEGPILVRRSVVEQLGGYAEDPELIGIEDHDFYCRLADAGVGVTFVQQMLVRGTPPPRVPVRPIDVAPERTWHRLRSRSPLLFAKAGLTPTTDGH